MLYRHIFVSHLFGFIFCMDQCIIKILPYVRLAALYLGSFPYRLFYTVHNQILVQSHLFNQFQNQTVVLSQKRIQKMLLHNLLIPILNGRFLTPLHCLQRLLCKFINIHNDEPPSP